MITTVIHASQLSPQQIHEIQQVIPGDPIAHAGHYRILHPQAVDYEHMAELRQRVQLDINSLPEGFEAEKVALVISDMDSTFIGIECIDEIADFAGIKPRVAEITEAAMRGELDFEQSLTQRVSLLEGLTGDALQRVYEERLTLNPGAENLLQGLRGRSIPFALVSGGFTFFTDRLKQRYKLDFTRSNTLEMEGDTLTGRVMGNIVGAEAKREFLFELCRQLKISPEQVIAMGDGANDLLMMKESGLSVAYHAKPRVQAEASCVLEHGGLDRVLDLIA
ncbi:MAG: phosphoserine phosphatase SerB [Gammaproteobacteria bacterium]|nr:phosphoserine phosphatase SerB [Gammaproteobacteria bacterium]